MNKPFLLIAGNTMTPQLGTDDWIACFSTYEEAKAQVRERTIKSTYDVKIVYDIDDETNCDWYEIVDLREWTER